MQKTAFVFVAFASLLLCGCKEDNTDELVRSTHDTAVAITAIQQQLAEVVKATAQIGSSSTQIANNTKQANDTLGALQKQLDQVNKQLASQSGSNTIILHLDPLKPYPIANMPQGWIQPIYVQNKGPGSVRIAGGGNPNPFCNIAAGKASGVTMMTHADMYADGGPADVIIFVYPMVTFASGISSNC